MKIGFLATRLAGTDGVSLETHKLAAVAQRYGHDVYYCAGELDRAGPPGMLIPEMHFQYPGAVAVGEQAFSGIDAAPSLLDDIATLSAPLLQGMQTFVERFAIEALVVENALAIPMQLPLGQALGQVIAETGLPTLAHHHDLYWERERFQRCRIPEFLDTYFPFDAPNTRHAVINSLAQKALKARRNLDAVLIPNVFDFEESAPGIDDYNADFRESIGVGDDQHLILQPTRVVPRKGIELAIELVSRLEMPDCVLVVTHQAGDEGLDYLYSLQRQADDLDVDFRYVASQCDSQRRIASGGGKIYSLWDAYPHADLVTYPSLYEGFGNALIETIYFRKPALVNRYSVYAADIAPLGFDFVEIDGRITDAAVSDVRHLLLDPDRRQAAVNKNYELASQHFSYSVLSSALEGLLSI